MSSAKNIDMTAMREKYAQERDRRLARKPDERQYRDIEQGFSHLLDDPYGVAPARDAIQGDTDVFIVGGGFGGLLTASRLKQAGITDFKIADVASDFGGTWYWNRYPGAACDVESYIYFPLLEETGYMPVERYSKANEIREHTVRIGKHFGLYDHALFSTQVTAVDWDESSARWTVKTNKGDDIYARFVVLTTGPLNRPKLPEIPGVETFAGHYFHTSRWDYGYTGGSATDPMTNLTGKRVAIIGTGATAIQAVPPLARDAKHVYVFQRTPSGVDVRNNSATDPAWWASLKPGWQRERMANFSAQFTSALPADDIVGDGWTVLAKTMREKFANNPGATDIAMLLDEADAEKMQMTRDRVDALVHDRATAEALKPWYGVYCKRPCFHDEYLQTFNRENVTLVDTEGRGVEQITPTGLVVGGKEYPVDCIIYATGFETGTGYEKRAGMEIRGVGGQTLSDKWSRGLSTLHGMHTRGFPNCFIISQAQSGMSPNFPHMLDEQTTHIAHIVEECLNKNIETIEPSAEAEGNWVNVIVEGTRPRMSILESCTPGYYNNEGRLSYAALTAGVFADGPLVFAQLLAEWRAKGDLTGLEVHGEHARGVEESQ